MTKFTKPADETSAALASLFPAFDGWTDGSTVVTVTNTAPEARTAPAAPATRMCSPKQAAFLTDLVNERKGIEAGSPDGMRRDTVRRQLNADYTANGRQTTELGGTAFPLVSAALARTAIDSLLAIKVPKETAPVATASTPSTPEPPVGTYTVAFDSEWRTFRLAHPKWANGAMVVSYLSGSDNTADYTTMAFVRGNRVVLFRKFAGNSGMERLGALAQTLVDPSVRTEAHEKFLANAELHALESGSCMRCGKTLTVPASLHRGLGPECAKIEGVL